MKKKKYIVVTIKSWNIAAANRLNKIAKANIKIITDPKDLNFDLVKKINPRYIFFPHWSWKIPQELYRNWECVVFHMTDLPFARGGSPLQNLIARGIYKTKISAIRVVKKIDAGPIYGKENLSLSGSARGIFERAAGIIFEKMIPSIIKHEPVPFTQKGKASVFRRRTKEESDISKLKDIRKIYDYIRMLDAEGYPPAYLENKKFKLEFTKAKMLKNTVLAQVKIELKEKG